MADKIKRIAIAEFILRNEGAPERRVQPGEEVELIGRQLERFAASGCVWADEERNSEEAEAAVARARAGKPAGRDPAEIAREQINTDKLFDLTVLQLKEIATNESIDLGGATKKDDLVAAIRAHRAGGAAAGQEGQRTDEGEAARRASDAAALTASGTTEEERLADKRQNAATTGGRSAPVSSAERNRSRAAKQ